MVHATAVQPHEDGGWYAQEIVVAEQTWTTNDCVDTGEQVDLQSLRSSVVVGKVTSFSSGAGTIDDHIAFRLEDCGADFLPFQGDWVSALVDETEVEEEGASEWDGANHVIHRTARQVNPLRTLEVEGHISAMMADHGYVNSQIYFTGSVCSSGLIPRRNDFVKAFCVESAQGKCQWRATRIVALSRKTDAFRLKSFKEVPKGIGTWLVPGQRPCFYQQGYAVPIRLPHFTVPDDLNTCVMDQKELTELCPYLARELSFANYVKRMSTLLHLEEIQMQMDIREFDLTRVCLHPVGEFLALNVPGLAEGRPSVLIGDKVILSVPYDPEGPCYEGYVHELTSCDVHLKFSPEFHSRYNGEDYDVVFTFHRIPLRRCHQAVSLAVQFLGAQVLFPSKIDLKAPQIKMQQTPSALQADDQTRRFPHENQNQNHKNGQMHNSSSSSSIHIQNPEQRHQFSYFRPQANQDKSPSSPQLQEEKLHRSPGPYCVKSQDKESQMYPSSSLGNNSMIIFNSERDQQTDVKFFNPKLNEEQQEAVTSILLAQCRSVPYVIFGPPGTGKTITVVEAILQVFARVPFSRILACTPSNSAADLITERLHLSQAVKQTDIVRLNAFQRSVEAIPETILKYCSFSSDLDKISRYRIIICTCSMAGVLYGLKLAVGHFTHVFVDECGQAVEPESLIPIGLLSGADGQVVLAGDPKQLGPTIMSPFAKMYGLELSLLERLMKLRLYERDEASSYNNHVVKMLVKNYRSNPSILELPSKLFYFNQLQPCADPALVNSLAHWSMLPSPRQPVLFHGIRGEDMRENNSPSWFNPGETLQVVRYCQGLLKEDVSPENIGIITPYRKQVEKIRLLMNRLSMPDVKVGSVEEFQGQERQAIIISTVRSNENLIGFDVRHTLGFLSNPKRFNVAITRAQALLVIVGNPWVLVKDFNWKMLIQECCRRGVYTGCDLPDLTGDEE